MSYGLKDVAKDALTGNLQAASEETVKRRMTICASCPHLRKNMLKNPSKIDGERCNLCGCYMPVKTKLLKATCPAKKW